MFIIRNCIGVNTTFVCFHKLRNESKWLSVLTDVMPHMLSIAALEDIQDSIKNTSPSAGTNTTPQARIQRCQWFGTLSNEFKQEELIRQPNNICRMEEHDTKWNPDSWITRDISWKLYLSFLAAAALSSHVTDC